jgi:dihydroorotate dehydrogenase (fumarate)/dihydroorotate dehydrogenase
MYESLIRPCLFRADPEDMHHAAVRAAELAGRWGWARSLARRWWSFEDPRLRQRVAGLDWANPLGLAAGFDKNGRTIHLLGAMGFGHVEIGSVSAFVSQGNPRPRLFRIPQDRGIVVHYGVPNEGAQAVRRRLLGQSCAVPVGINLVKTNDRARPAVEPDVYEDYAQSVRQLQDVASYLVLNMSCPNSPGDRDFLDDPARMRKLLDAVAAEGPRRPVFLKLKPTQDAGRLREIVALAREFAWVAGFGINLAAGKPSSLELKTPARRLAGMPGAVSGRPAEGYINAMLGELYRIVGPRSRFALMAAGGVFSAEDAYRKIRLGASLVQLYTGLVYRGPRIVRDVLSGLVRLLERDGFAHVGAAVGAEHGCSSLHSDCPQMRDSAGPAGTTC